MSNEREVLLNVSHLKQHFKLRGTTIKAVDDISFDIYKGEVLGLVGESGCGKTTTGRSIIRLYECTGGDVFFKDQRIGLGVPDRKAEIKEARRAGEMQKASELTAKLEEDKRAYEKAIGSGIMSKMQMIFQDPIASLNPRMTVREIISEGLTIRGIRDKAFVDAKVKEVLELVGLVGDHAERYPHEFSGGQRQRIGIARAIVLEPDIIIADEPISALDVSIQAQVINLLNDLREQMGLTILFIAHDLSVVKYFSDRIAVMYYGKIVELADSNELFKHPLHPYTRSLLSAIPLPDPHYEKRRKRITYVPALEHDYAEEQPTLCEIRPNHYVSCDSKEREKYMTIADRR
ncbi:MAG: ATP-binding cassette domain-containing protein [Clostridiaceae bacterium]|nr:ATP-binding cassette domain-containing protein [Eubacteriales bacterium]